MNLIFFDNNKRIDLLPFTFTRTMADIRMGILTIREKWEKHFNCVSSSLTVNYLSAKFPIKIDYDNILIAGNICPTKELLKTIEYLPINSILKNGNIVIAARLDRENLNILQQSHRELNDSFELSFDFITNEEHFLSEIFEIKHVWDIFSKNGKAIEDDFALLTKNRQSQPIPANNQFKNPEKIFIEEGAKIDFSILNADSGPIYIGKDAEVMDGSIIRGPFALCEHSSTKLATKIYGPTTVGPYSKVGGELNNVVIFGYSNKGHDGFIGNAVIGEWCNLGADTNCSNLKNNYAEVKLWSYKDQKMIPTGLTFCGLQMGDHSKCGINTMFNTGTLVGVGANIYGGDFPPTFIPSFSWGGAAGFENYQFDKFIETAKRVYQRRNLDLSKIDIDILGKIYEMNNLL